MSLNQNVYDVSSKPIITIDLSEYVLNAVDFMYKRGVRRLAVKSGNKIVGIFSAFSLLNVLLEGSDASSLSISSVELENSVFVDKITPIKDAIKIMGDKSLTSLLVGNEENVYGMFTTHDIVEILSKSSFRNSVYYVLKADYPKLEINKNKVRDVIDLMVNKLSSGVIIVDNDYYLGVITLRDILKTYADQGIKALDLELNALPIIEGVYSDIGSTISELASLMYIKGSDVAAIFCGNSLCGGVDDLALFNYLYSNLNKE